MLDIAEISILKHEARGARMYTTIRHRSTGVVEDMRSVALLYALGMEQRAMFLRALERTVCRAPKHEED